MLKSPIQQYHDCTCKCGCYGRDMDGQADRAISFLRKCAARRKLGEKLTLLLNIGETTLSNCKEMVDAGFTYNKEAFGASVRMAKAPIIPGSLRLYREAQKLNLKVIFITGRVEGDREATARNLHAMGIAH